MDEAKWQQQRRDFVELALKLIEARNFEDNLVLRVDRGKVHLRNWYTEWDIVILKHHHYGNEVVIKKLKNILEQYK